MEPKEQAADGRSVELAAEAASRRIREELRFLAAVSGHPSIRRAQREVEESLSWLAYDLTNAGAGAGI
ncbi:hypothetical protein [Streptomyces sviceus]|uniref:hypothetical protein n=1 Tax=Streptomyces sviceus TaxID=285530 RepID=UPI00333261E4